VVQVLPTPQQVASCAPGWQSDEPAGQVETH
jgi:carbon monoxide dehydrogenase subunit G